MSNAQPLKMTTESVSMQMQAFMRSDAYAILWHFLKQERDRIEGDGKKARDGMAWAVLDGFDRAMRMPEKLAAKLEQKQQLADILGDQQ